ncbi:type VI secretion system lipoprotein TssJ [Variovorax sp. PAMC 28711]|uniref:type VI secretion system lipoprotein TssJ n=1 Tax=Variovorax sp. PAMC 28711 TaxID=1795631 RepID=UPI00078C168B|nr:type VI secretion system lipoprotein TssJ [Variovorax sp. PAMC 28711]AMM25121.1 type VI secretion protein [Variovorax sp. PAMC 28711]
MRLPGTRRLFYGRFFGLALAAFVLAGCATKPVVTPVSLTLMAAPDVNPDARNRASPLTVRIYALKSPGPFEGADFFSLYEKDQATLGAEMVQREELLLRPGDSKKLALTLPAEVKAIGVLAAYRDLERARWREVRAVEPGKPLGLMVTFGARQIRIDASK